VALAARIRRTPRGRNPFSPKFEHIPLRQKNPADVRGQKTHIDSTARINFKCIDSRYRSALPPQSDKHNDGRDSLRVNTQILKKYSKKKKSKKDMYVNALKGQHPSRSECNSLRRTLQRDRQRRKTLLLK